MSYLEELKDKQLFRIATAYLFVSWVFLQLADLVLENFGAPGWIIRGVMFALFLGFPFVVLVAWLHEKGSSALLSVSLIGSACILVFGVTWLAWEDITGDGPADSDVQVQAKPLVIESIAVLPFESFSEDKSDQYFADGLADTLLHRLARLSTLDVIARNSSFQFKGTNRDAREIGELLGADVLLEGSVQRQGDNIRVIAQLISTADGLHLWSNTFDSTRSNIFELQDDIARALVEQLQITVTELETDRLMRRGTDSVEAYELVLRSRALRDSIDRPDFDPDTDEMVSLINQALEIDPDYALAWAYKSNLYDIAAFTGSDLSRFDDYVAEAERSAKLAIEKDPELAEGHVSLGFVYWRRNEVSRAMEVWNRALQLDPNAVSAMSGIALATMVSDPLGAEKLLRQVRRLDPRAAMVHRQLSFLYLRLGDLERAESILEEGIERFPQIDLFYGDLADLRLDNLGRPDLAAVAVGSVLNQFDTSLVGYQAMVEAWMAVGDIERATAWYRVLQREFPDSGRVPRFSAVLRFLGADVPLEGSGERDVSDPSMMLILMKTRAVICHAQDDTACIRQQIAELTRLQALLKEQGNEFVEYERNTLVVMLLQAVAGDAIDQEAAESALSSIEHWPVMYTGGEFKYQGYLRPLLFAAMGDHEAAGQALIETLENTSDGAISPWAFDHIPILVNPLLNPLKDTESFQRWQSAFEQRVDALRETMVSLEANGDIASPPL